MPPLPPALLSKQNTVKGGSESHLHRGIQNPTQSRELLVPDTALGLYFDRASIAPTENINTSPGITDIQVRDVSSKAMFMYKVHVHPDSDTGDPLGGNTKRWVVKQSVKLSPELTPTHLLENF